MDPYRIFLKYDFTKPVSKYFLWIQKIHKKYLETNIGVINSIIIILKNDSLSIH